MLWATALATDGTGLTDMAPLINLGAVGLICAVLIAYVKTTVADRISDLRAQRDAAQEDARRRTRIVELEREIAALQAARDEAQDDLKALNSELRSQTVPALVEATRTMARVVHLLEERR